MTGMEEPPSYDLIQKSSREASGFNNAWLKHGEKMTWMQRIGFALFSCVLFGAGLSFLRCMIEDIHQAELLGAIGWSFPTLFFLVPGILGLRNVLRF